MHFGATLRLLRIDAGFSLRALAQRIGVSSAYLSRVEHGYDAVPTPDRLVAIARALGLQPQLLMELGHQVEPLLARYLETVPAASTLFLDIARRNLGGPQLARIKAFIDAEFPVGGHQQGSGAPPARLSSLLSPERIILHLSCTDIEDVIELAASRLAPTAGGLSASALGQEILRRERESSTALGSGVGVPHALLPGVPTAAVLVTLARPLQVPTPDDIPLRLLVVLVCSERGRRHLEMLAQVARLASHDAAAGLYAARDPVQFIQQLSQFEASCG
jgi:nitrogen PTS system EIIA component